jgi:SNF2 family DNA or RNA helicase
MDSIDSFCELSADGKRIEVYFPYNPEAVAKISGKSFAGVKYPGVPGAKFVPRDKGGPHWTIPLDMISAQRLRDAMGEGLELGKAITEWGRVHVAEARNLATLATADDAKLKVLPDVLPDLAAFLRPFQRADVAFMAKASVMNSNEQGLGKTVEAIAAVFEGELDMGPQLVVAPLTSHETVWKYEIDTHVGDPVFILNGESYPDMREIKRLLRAKEPFWFITTANQIRKGLPAPLNTVKWKTLIIDEFHKTGLTNVSGDPSKGTQFGRAVRAIKRERSFFLSGTPMGGKPIKLWGVLNHLKPDVFTSKWRWAEQWLHISEGWGGHKEISGLRPDTIEKFYPAHAQFIVRRLKKEVLPQLPDKQYINVWCKMTGSQAKQYATMDDLAETRIDDERLSANGILAEYTRLKQFAAAERSMTKTMITKRSGEVVEHIDLPIKSSNKLPYLIDKLNEIGIDPDDPTGDAVAVVASQSKVFIKWIADALNKAGIRTELITGDTKAKERASIVKRFQSGKDSPRVIAVTTTAGGVAITLDRADTVHILDETWDPDDQAQLEDRIHRISRIHQVMCYYYRSEGTIEEDIFVANEGKATTTRNIMDVRRQMFKNREEAA